VLEDALNGATKDDQDGGSDDAQESKDQTVLNHRLAALVAQVKKAHPGICDNCVDELQSLNSPRFLSFTEAVFCCVGGFQSYPRHTRESGLQDR